LDNSYSQTGFVVAPENLISEAKKLFAMLDRYKINTRTNAIRIDL
jgi:hypothetical protein